VTVTRERESAPSGLPWDRRAIFSSVRGWPWWGAVLLALALSLIGAFVDMQANKKLDVLFDAGYLIGCIAAVCVVRRRSVFGPMVQPPLILVVTVPVVMIATGLPAGTANKALTIGTPLVDAFPTMAICTGITVVIAVIRYLTQRKPDDAAVEAGASRSAADRDARRAQSRAGSRDDSRGERRTGSRGDGRSDGRGDARDDSLGDVRGDRGNRSDRGRASARPDRDAAPRNRPDRGSRADRGDGGDRAGRSDRESDSGRGRPTGDRADRGRGEQGRNRPSSGRPQRDRSTGGDRSGRPPRDQPRGSSGSDPRRQPPRRRGDDDYYD
jgi:hypothetical protein